MSDVTLGVFGIDGRDQYGLGLAFRQHQPNRYTIVAFDDAAVAVVDGDALGAAAVVAAELARSPRRPVLLMTLARPYDVASHPRVMVLTKPIAVPTILAALDDLAKPPGAPEPPPEPAPAPPPQPAPAPPPRPPEPAPPPEPRPPEPAPPPRPAPPRSEPLESSGPTPDALPPGEVTNVPITPTPEPASAIAHRTPAGTADSPAGRPNVGDADTTWDAPTTEVDTVDPRPVGGAETARMAGEGLMVLIGQDQPPLPLDPGRAGERYDPARVLDGCLAFLVARAHRTGRPTALADDGDGVVYDPGSLTFASTGYFDWLDELARSGAPCSHLMTSETTDLVVAHHPRRSASAVLWRAGLLCSGGRLRTGIDSDRPLELRFWPVLTRLDTVDGLVSILAALSAGSFSIDDLVAEGCQRHAINATVGALASIHALEFGPEVSSAWMATPEARRSRPLLRRLRRRQKR